MCLRGLGGEEDGVPTCVAWGEKEMDEDCDGVQKSCEDGKAILAPSLIALDVQNSSSEKKSVWEAAVIHVHNWKG